jgi:hypothetical protein
VVTSVTGSRPKRERESHIPDFSNSNNDNSEGTFAEFDLRHLEHDMGNNLNTLDDKNNSSTEDEDDLFPRNLMYDPDRVLDGMLVLKCPFCKGYKNPLEYDMKRHLRYTHKDKLLTNLHLEGKGFNMEYRAAYAIDIMKQRGPPEYYDHRKPQDLPPKLKIMCWIFLYINTSWGKYFLSAATVQHVCTPNKADSSLFGLRLCIFVIYVQRSHFR